MSILKDSTACFENIGWTVGSYCNAQCGHCYSWKIRRDTQEFITKYDVDKIIKQLVNLGVKTVNLGGNEPIYTHGNNIYNTILPYIISSLNDANILVGLTTNSTTFLHLHKYYPKELSMINDIDFSLDSPIRDEHDLNRGTQLFDRTINAIKICRELEIDCSIVTCGTKANFNPAYLSKFIQLSREFDCEFRVNILKPIEPDLRGDMPGVKEFYDGFEYLLNHTDCVVLGESCIASLMDTGSKGCPCGKYSFRINAKDARGRISISPCVYLHDFRVGDLLSEDIFDILNSESFQKFANRKFNLPDECNPRCNYYDYCRGGCAARAYLLSGNLNAKDPYCPNDYFQNYPEIKSPKNCTLNQENDVRVHENYLCTWIGKAHPKKCPEN